MGGLRDGRCLANNGVMEEERRRERGIWAVKREDLLEINPGTRNLGRSGDLGYRKSEENASGTNHCGDYQSRRKGNRGFPPEGGGIGDAVEKKVAKIQKARRSKETGVAIQLSD